MSTTADRPGSIYAYLVVLPDLTDKVGEGLVDVDALLGRGLDEFAAEVLREVTAL